MYLPSPIIIYKYITVGIFDLEYVKVIWGHSVHFSENWAVTQKRLIVERNGRKFGLQRCK